MSGVTLKKLRGSLLACLPIWLLATGANPAHADTFTWNTTRDRVTVDVRGMNVTNLMMSVARETGWHVFLEPGIGHVTSTKFRDLSSGEALRMLLGDVNFALIPETSGPSRLYVFRTARNNATQRISAALTKKTPRRVPNELIVKLKPGQSIEEIARKLGAKVKGSLPEMNAYLLEFEDEQSTNEAAKSLAEDPNVEGTDANYYVDAPEPAQNMISDTSLPPKLQIKPGTDSSGLVVGIVDTAVQSLGSELDKLILKRWSVDGNTSAAGGSEPLHGTTMLESILRGMESMGVTDAGARFKLYNVFDNNGSTTTWNVATAMVGLVNDGISWMNVSLGSGGDSKFLADVVKDISGRGIAIFAAAGNEPTGQAVFPAAYEGTVAVTALKDKNQLASYANMADFVDLAGPGSGVVYYQGKPYYVQGTSVSTAWMTGAAVGIAQRNAAAWPQVKPVLSKSFPAPKR
jgi:hypothetical protein